MMNENLEMNSRQQEADTSIAFYEFNDQFIPTDDSLSKREIGRSFYQLGKLHYDKSDLDAAEENFLKSLKCAERPRDIFSIFKILGFLIRISSEKLDDEKATAYIAHAEELVDDLTKVLGSLNAEYFYNVGIVKNYSGKFQEAYDNFQFAYKKSKEENEPDILAKTLLALSNNCYNRKDYKGALDYLSQLNQLLAIIKKDYLSGAMYLFSAKVYLEVEDFENSLKFFKLANETLQTKKCWNLFGYILLGKGNVYKNMGDFDRALEYFNLASESIDPNVFKRLSNLLKSEIEEVNDSSVDLYLDRNNRKIKERSLGSIDFKHRFVLLEILFLLAKNPGEYFDKEQLAKSIWKDEYNPLIHDKLIYTSVSRLRKLIEPKAAKGEKRKYIIRGKDGYTFNPSAKIRFHMETKNIDDKTIANVELSSPV
ncbi:winged helix-turn-helix domain-containing protein [Halobacteriovorax marinus]|uniref:winged helix-turn-helix domain-containing protein n=1 Tax=Halobacteriovorax marinus TaxID=97084 RepID=UPI003A8DDEF5